VAYFVSVKLSRWETPASLLAGESAYVPMSHSTRKCHSGLSFLQTWRAYVSSVARECARRGRFLSRLLPVDQRAGAASVTAYALIPSYGLMAQRWTWTTATPSYGAAADFIDAARLSSTRHQEW